MFNAKSTIFRWINFEVTMHNLRLNPLYAVRTSNVYESWLTEWLLGYRILYGALAHLVRASRS